MTINLVRRAATALSPLVLFIASTAPAHARETPAKAAAPTAVNPQDAAAKAWNFAASDIPVDPNIVFGVLPNGMKYALLNNSTPKGSVVIRTRFDVGSFAEADDPRGLAHFLTYGVQRTATCARGRDDQPSQTHGAKQETRRVG